MIVRSPYSDLGLEKPNGDVPYTLSWRWSADQFLKMISAGVIDEADRIELIDGEIICMSPAEVSHNRTVANLNRCFVSVMESHEVLVQSTIRLSDTSVVDPDLAILKRPNSQDAGKLPTPEDVLLLVEVAHSSLKKDLSIKSELYAQASIPEYWVADIENASLIVHRQPKRGRYGSCVTLRGQEQAIPELIAGIGMTPAAIFG